MEQKQTETTAENTNPPREGSTFEAADFFREHLVRGEDNKIAILGDNLSPMELALLDIEVKRRGEQGATSREKARADRSELELSKVKENVRGISSLPEIDPQLKYSDPDEYIKQTLEAQGKDPYQDVFNAASTQAAQEVGQITMEGLIASHNQSNPTKQITEGMLQLDLPPRLMNEFSSGKVSPQDFLRQAADLLYRPTEVANQPVPGMPDLGTVAGQTTPSDDGSNDKMLANYGKAIF